MLADRQLFRAAKTTKLSSRSALVVAMLALLTTTALSAQAAVPIGEDLSAGNHSMSANNEDRLIRHHHHQGRSRYVRSGARHDAGRSLGAASTSGGSGVHDALSSYEASVRRLPVETMMSKLGDDFDAEWMSVERPPANHTSTSPPDDPELLNHIRRLRFTYRDERGDEHQFRSSVMRQFEKWLLDRARCEVRYSWDDLGLSFWPRWVRHGSCDTRATCSWPPGMHCLAAESGTIRLLHWQCRRSSGRDRRHAASGRKNVATTTKSTSKSTESRSGRAANLVRRRMRSERTQCRWKKVPYPVTSECFCSC